MPRKVKTEADRVKQRACMATRHARHRARIIAIKLASRCADCGWQPRDAEEAKLLDFDHRDPESKAVPGIGAFRYSWSWARIEAELALCDTRCKSCHGRRTGRYLHNQRRPTVAT